MKTTMKKAARAVQSAVLAGTWIAGTAAAQEAPQGLERALHGRDRHPLVPAVGELRLAGTEVDGVQPASGELCHRCPRLLGPDLQVSGRPEALQERVAGGDRGRRRVAQNGQLPPLFDPPVPRLAHKLPQAILSLGG